MSGGPCDDEDFARLLSARRSGSADEAERLFELLVHLHQHNVFKLVVSILGPGRGAEAEEVTQDVFLRVHRRLESFRSESKFSSWLYRIAYRRAVDLKRLARFRLPHLADEVLSTLPAPSSDPDSNALRREASVELYAAVMALPQQQRSAVMLHYLDGGGPGDHRSATQPSAGSGQVASLPGPATLVGASRSRGCRTAAMTRPEGMDVTHSSKATEKQIDTALRATLGRAPVPRLSPAFVRDLGIERRRRRQQQAGTWVGLRRALPCALLVALYLLVGALATPWLTDRLGGQPLPAQAMAVLAAAAVFAVMTSAGMTVLFLTRRRT